MAASRRENNSKRVFKDVGSLQRMGEALGWRRGIGNTTAFPKENAQFGSKAGNAAGEIPPHQLNATPGKGHVSTSDGSFKGRSEDGNYNVTYHSAGTHGIRDNTKVYQAPNPYKRKK